MRKVLLLASLVLALCAGGYLAVQATGPGRTGGLVGALVGNVPAMSEAEVESHRETRYSAIDSIEELLALPHHFTRMEALYVLAGRSDSPAVQNLIFQAHGIDDASDRRDVLLVLFARLTELDAPSALALSGTPDFAAEPLFESEVWRRWGGLDLDAALAHAARLDGPSRNRAAQALFAAFADGDDEETSQIAERLRAEPDNRARSARLDGLAYADPAAAVAFANSLDSPLHRQQAAAHLGRLLGQNGIDAADRWSASFHEPVMRRAFEDAAARSAAEVDPEGTLERLLAGGGNRPDDGGKGNDSRLASALLAIAAQDPDRALRWYERLEEPRQRWRAGNAIATQLALADPLRALAWARDNDGSLERRLYTTVLTTLAETEPELAFADAQSLDHRWHRMSALMAVAREASRHDPERAAALMRQVEDPDARNVVMQQITINWMQADPDAALDWIMSEEVRNRRDLMNAAAQIVAGSDLDAALELLPRLDKDVAPAWRQHIAVNMAAHKSVEQAESFVAQFEGSPDYPQLVGGMIQGLAQTDAPAALRMLDRAPEGYDRGLLTSIVYMHYAQQSPRDAAEAAMSIEDPRERANVIGTVLGQWSQADAAAAERWAGDRPRGKERDHAIAGVGSRWDELTPARRRMLENIGDRNLQKQTITNVIFRIARYDRERAEQALRGMDLPEDDRQEILQGLDRMRRHSPSMYVRGF